MRNSLLKSLSIFSLSLLVFSCRGENPVEDSSFVGNDIFTNIDLTTIYSPEYQKNYPPGKSLTIKWEPTLGVDKVTIKLYKKSEHRDQIVQGYPNTGEYVWQIPSGITRSHHYKVVIQDDVLMNYSSTSPVFYILDN